MVRGQDQDRCNFDSRFVPFQDASLLDVAGIQLELEALPDLSVALGTHFSSSFRDNVVLAV